MRKVIITKELLIDAMGACDIGPGFIEENNMWGQYDEDVILPALLEAGFVKEVEWWREQKLTKKFLLATGKVFTMGAYRVYNTATGQHEQYETESEALAALAVINNAILDAHGPRIVQELSNEHGDAVWETTSLHERVRAGVIP